MLHEEREGESISHPSNTITWLHVGLWPIHINSLSLVSFKVFKTNSNIKSPPKRPPGCILFRSFYVGWINVRDFLDITGRDPKASIPLGYMLTSFKFSLLNYARYILQIPLKQSVISVESWTPTGYFSNSTGWTNPYTRSLLDAKTLAFKEPMHKLVRPNHM
jgi:hypothetical protein